MNRDQEYNFAMINTPIVPELDSSWEVTYSVWYKKNGGVDYIVYNYCNKRNNDCWSYTKRSFNKVLDIEHLPPTRKHRSRNWSFLPGNYTGD